MMKNNKKIIILIGILGLLVVTGLVYVSLMTFTPTDVKILSVLEKNKELLLSIDGVVGAGIARNEFNHITGIAIYIEDTADVQKIPKNLGGFDIVVKKIDEMSEREKKNLLYMSLPVLKVLKRHQSSLMNVPGVIGVGIGECNGMSCIKVYLEKETPESKDIPKEIEGFKVDVEVIGLIEALEK